MSLMSSGWELTDYPVVLGHEVIETAVRVGSDIKHLKSATADDVPRVPNCFRPATSPTACMATPLALIFSMFTVSCLRSSHLVLSILLNIDISGASLQALPKARRLRTTSARQPTSPSPASRKLTLLPLLLC